MIDKSIITPTFIRENLWSDNDCVHIRLLNKLGNILSEDEKDLLIECAERNTVVIACPTCGRVEDIVINYDKITEEFLAVL